MTPHLDELLSAYLDGETTTEESRRVDVHVAECLKCRRRLSALNRARAAIRSLPTLEMPAIVVVPEEEPAPRRRRPVWLGAAAAAVAAIIAVATITAPGPEPLDLSEVSRAVGARAALDTGIGSLKIVVPAGMSG